MRIVKNHFKEHPVVRYLFMIPAFLFCSFQLFGISKSEVKYLFIQGNEYYQQKDYLSALAMYDSIEKTGAYSSALYFNIGNTYYKLASYPEAILYYEKAKLAGGTNRELEHNLALSNLNIIDKIEPLPQFFLARIWENILFLAKSSTWAWFMIIILWAVVILIILLYITNSLILRKIFLPLILLTSVLFIFSTIFSIQRNSVEKKHNYAIVFTPTVFVKSAPDKQSTDLFIIHEGCKIKILDSLNDWVKIKLEDGKTGWLQKSSYKLI